MHSQVGGVAPAAAELQTRCLNAIRILSADMVEAANSGHPGAPMGMAAMAYTVWMRHLRHDPDDPSWVDRDRFVLSAGHASALLYSMLHLTGYDLPIEELRAFRQWGSKTPGHPENELTVGVETTTGPLGQGFAQGVGMAIAEAWLAERFNRDGHALIDHHVYAFVSDGDLQEGVAAEAASLAGTLELGKLIYLYDDNGIQIEGSTDTNFTEDVAARFRAYGWHVVDGVDGLDVDAIDAAVTEAKEATDRPSLIVCRTQIAFGSPGKVGTAASHGSPLGADELAATRENLGWSDPPFEIPDDIYEHFAGAGERGAALSSAWRERCDDWADAAPEMVTEFSSLMSGDLPDGWEDALSGLFEGAGPMPTRKASGMALNALAGVLPHVLGGSADLGPSNNTVIKDSPSFSADARGGRNFHFGVREHAMGAIASGMALHGGVIPYTGTFLTFSDYMRGAIRLTALMKQRVIYVFTHDSIGLGEDGPTHQSVEHVAALRAIPNLAVIRPGDAPETAEAWRAAIRRTDGPTALILTRQNVAAVDRERHGSAEGLHRGAYVMRDPEGTPDILLLATGSELGLCLEAAGALADRGVQARVVNMPCWELFREQPAAYRKSVLPGTVTARLAVEAGVRQGWDEWLLGGDMIAMDGYGASAPAPIAFEKFGFTVENVVARALALAGREG